MSQYFSETQLDSFLDNWPADYCLKKHDGQIRQVEASKQYLVGGEIESTKQFVIQVSRLYEFLTIERKENVITVQASVKPSSLDDFLQFCHQLPNEEKYLTKR